MARIIEGIERRLPQTTLKDSEPAEEPVGGWKTPCARCGNDGPDVVLNMWGMCAECSAARKVQALEERWASFCPPRFRATEFEKLPCQAASRRCMEWVWGPTGLLMHGETRTGKSRTAWLILKREMIEKGRSVAVLNSTSGIKFAATFSESCAAAQAWVEHHQKVNVLLMDDSWKAKVTDAFENAVFSIVDYRSEYCLPIIATTNDTADTMKVRMTADRATPLIERLKEFCVDVPFVRDGETEGEEA